MYFDPQSGRVRQARWTASPNFNHRPHPDFVNALVIHAISLPPDCFGNSFVEEFFCNTLDCTQHPYFESIADLKVSSHFYIRRNGELVQFVATTDRAWHAGLSELQGLDTVNDFSIGIELEGCDEQDFCDAQYTALVTLSQCLMEAYPAITKPRIVGHSEIAPGRKTDPGPCFDWQRYRGKL
jgi:N-acetyl-anhydromuramoyl-L-alanine amidase